MNETPEGTAHSLTLRSFPKRENERGRDAFAKSKGISLSQMLGGTRKKIDVGVSIGIQDSVSGLIKKVEGYLAEGYKRIKIKIAPGLDMQFVEALRKEFPGLMLQVDANSAYTLNDIELFKKMDHYDLSLIEQPLGYEDIYDHSKMQRELKTPICLDESIHSLDDTRAAIELDHALLLLKEEHGGHERLEGSACQHPLGAR